MEDTRNRTPQTNRPHANRAPSGEALPPARPFTTMGSTLLHLNSTQQNNNESTPTRTRHPPATAGAVLGHQQFGATEGDFDVRQFLLDQKGSQPLHKSALFRAPSLARQQQVVYSDTGVESSSRGYSRSKKLVLPRMELSSSQSTGALPVTASQRRWPLGNRGGEPNQQSDEEDEAISHFYTVEKMAESCFHATQNRNRTWLFLPGSDERSKGSNGASSTHGGSITGVERPSRRVDVLDLDRCFDTAIQFMHKKKHWDIACDDKLSMIDRDFMATYARITQLYAPAAGSEACPTTGDHKVLAKLLFQQKWSDVVLGELEAMLTVSFLEQGMLLRKTRINYAQAFFHLEQLYGEQWRELAQALTDLEQVREEVRQANELHAQDAQGMKEHYEGEIQRMTANFESLKAEMERRLGDSKDQMTKMGDTMKTLNAVFRQMREDTEKVKAVELRENYVKLEQKYDHCREEVETLRPLVQEKQKLLEQIDQLIRERSAFQDQIVNLNQLLGAKDAMVASLLEQQSDLIAAQELRAAKEEELRKQEEEDAEEDEREAARDEAEATAAGREVGQRLSRRKSSVVVCVRCKNELREMSANGGLLEGGKGGGSGSSDVQSSRNGSSLLAVDAANERAKVAVAKKKRVQCLYFRILLPNLGGRRPQRDVSWTFSCMRSIMFAKQIDDSMCKRSGGAFPLRVRMPEFVYAWFAPWRSIKDEKTLTEVGSPVGSARSDDRSSRDGSSAPPFAMSSSEQRQMQADEDRWCLYYGVRSLVQQGYLEAKLFLSLLDEKYGEDEQVFMLYCYRILDILIGGRLDWGPLRHKVSYENFARSYDGLFGGVASPDSGDSPANAPLAIVHTPQIPQTPQTPQTPQLGSRTRVPKTIWISPHHASLATSVVLSKATEAERLGLDKKILEYVVTNVPEEEKPTVYLVPQETKPAEPTPAEAETKDEADSRHKKRRGRLDRRGKSKSDQDDTSNGDAPSPQQFVDANLWVELMMLEYKEEQAHRRAAIRLMFQTATSSSAAAATESAANMTLSAMLGINSASMDMEQFRVMVRTLNDEIPSFMVATLFRNAYTRGNGTVNYESFMEAAEAGQFFSTCMRLESPASMVARLSIDPHSPTSAASSTSQRAAFIVEKFSAILRSEMQTTIAALPVWTRSMTDALSYEITSSLMEGSFCDGMRLLTSFHRLIDTLGSAKLVQREVMGGVFSSKNLFSLERALQGLVEFARQRDKSAVEILVDAVKHKLCVKRVQVTFRKYLQRDQGAPLIMRPMMHRRYGSGVLDYSKRRAERSVLWLHLVISSLLRQSLLSERMPTLLSELSGLSSAFHSGRPSSLHLSVSSALNGGIGPTPKSVFVELIYDYFLEKFGTRCEAERVVHDVFANCRSLVRTDPLALLFSYLCCMSNASPDDRLLGQNEALSFLHAIFRCGLHRFRLINPHVVVPAKTTRLQSPIATPEDVDTEAQSEHSSEIPSADDAPVLSALGPPDYVPIDVVETILLSAFVKLGADQKMRLRMRIAEAALDKKDSLPPSKLEANAFLVLALHEWRRYILHRLNDIRVNCCALEEELTQFEELLQLETLGAILQKTGVAYNSGDLCMVFRRLCITESAPQRDNNASSARSNGLHTAPSPPDPMSDRIAAACFPLVVREALSELQALEHAAAEPFKVVASPRQSYEFLVSTWNDYQGPCRYLLDQLRQIGKNNDIQAKAFSHSPFATGASARTSGATPDVLYLSSSSSADTVSSQDVAQQEALHTLFMERLQRLSEIFEEGIGGDSRVPASRRSSISVKGDGSLLLVDEANAQEVLVHETWKVFRQMFVGFVKLRAVARLGKGALPDEWDTPTFM